MSDIIREGQLRERRDLQDSLYRYQGIFLLKKIHGVNSYFDVEVGGTRVTSQILVRDSLVIFLWNFLGRNHKHF